MPGWEEYKRKKQALAAAIEKADGQVALQKQTSNLFRGRAQGQVARLDVRDFHGVIAINAASATVDVMGMTTHEELVAATLPQGFMPAVVPQLKSITVGGAIAGLGIESSSFRFGLMHETMQEIEVLLGDGSVVLARPDNEHRDLFYGFPNSYGTLGYVLRAKLKLVPVRPYVRLRHLPFTDDQKYFEAIGAIAESGKYQGEPVDFMDGTVFESSRNYLTLGTMADAAPRASKYDYLQIYFKSIPQKTEDYLSIHDYIWRWDPDWFWCSKNIPGAQNRLLRLLFGKWYLRSTFYWKMMALNNKYNLLGKWQKLSRQPARPVEAVIQDVEIPLENCAAFLQWFQVTIGIKPVWICPLAAYDKSAKYALYPMDPAKTYVNFGFWDTVPTDQPEGHYNRLIEQKVEELGGKKSLYSSSYYSEADFWRLYNRPAFEALKRKYDPTGRFKDLYEKCVKGN